MYSTVTGMSRPRPATKTSIGGHTQSDETDKLDQIGGPVFRDVAQQFGRISRGYRRHEQQDHRDERQANEHQPRDAPDPETGLPRGRG